MKRVQALRQASASKGVSAFRRVSPLKQISTLRRKPLWTGSSGACSKNYDAGTDWERI